jgi:hypothetical protein
MPNPPPPQANPPPQEPPQQKSWIGRSLHGIKTLLEDEILGPLARSVPPPIAGLILVSLSAIAALGERFTPTVACVMLVIVAVVTVAYFQFYHRRFKRKSDEVELKSREIEKFVNVPTPAGMVWSRLQVNLNLPDETVKELYNLLERVHAEAFTFLSKQGVNVPVNNLRVNIMLPDNRHASFGDVCQLTIPESLHLNMGDSPDVKIKFSLNQGLVGKVYSSSQAGIAVFKDGVWRRIFIGREEPRNPNEPDFELTESQKRVLPPDLYWVLSMPLLYSDRTGELAMGVLDIDGRGFNVEAEVIKKLCPVVVEIVYLVAGKLNERPKERVSIFKEHV